MWNESSPHVQWGVVIIASLAAAIVDLRTRRIPNWLTGSLFLVGVLRACLGYGLAGLGDGLVGCLIMALPFVLLFAFAGGGAADAKLMGALGVWLGTRNGLVAVAAVSVAGGLLGVIHAIMRRRFRGVIANLALLGWGFWGMLATRGRWADAAAAIPQPQAMLPMPYGLSIFVGICLADIGVLHCRAHGLL